MYSYKVKVHKKKNQEKTYLWGAQDLKVALDSNLFLTIRVDDFGELIDLYQYKLDGDTRVEKKLGALGQSEVFTLSLKGLAGVAAACKDEEVDTNVECCIFGTNGSQ